MRRWSSLWLLVLLTGTADFAWAGRPKTDTVWTDSGDKVVCEIIELVHAKLTVKTNDMGTIQIKWSNIAALYSSHYFRVETRLGERFFGSIVREPTDPHLYIRRAQDTVRVASADIVDISSVHETFWSRWDGSLSLGFSYTRASGVAQLTLDWTNVYKTERDIVDLKAKTIITGRNESDTTARREDFSIAYYRMTTKKLIASVSSALQRNDEIGLLRRAIFALTAGMTPFRTNLHTMLLTAGVALNNEIGTADTSQVTQSAEGVFRVNYSLFKYTSPKSDINTTLTYFPSLTEDGRHRIDFDIKFRYELVKDFYIDLSYYTNYDSKPATEGAAKADFGIITSIAWSY